MKDFWNMIKLVWNIIKLVVLILWELLMVIAIIAEPESLLVIGVICGIVPLIMYVRGDRTALKAISELKEDSRNKKRVANIPYSEFYQRLNNNKCSLYIKSTLTLADFYKGIYVNGKSVRVGEFSRDKEFLYSQYGLRNLTGDEQEILTYWILDNCVKNANLGSYTCSVKPYYEYLGGTSNYQSAPVYVQTVNGDFVPSSRDDGPTKKFAGYKLVVRSEKTSLDVTEW